jgi:hypothetical protein
LDIDDGTVHTANYYNDGNWHQLILVAPTNADFTTLSCFVDGVLQTNMTYDDNPPINTVGTDPLIMGQLYISGDERYLAGSLDDIRIYNRALSTNEVAQLYAFESQPAGAPIVVLKKAVIPSFSNLYPGSKYQLQVSGDLTTWTNSGLLFTPTNPVMDYPQSFNVNNWNALYFRLQVSP